MKVNLQYAICKRRYFLLNFAPCRRLLVTSEELAEGAGMNTLLSPPPSATAAPYDVYDKGRICNCHCEEKRYVFGFELTQSEIVWIDIWTTSILNIMLLGYLVIRLRPAPNNGAIQ